MTNEQIVMKISGNSIIGNVILSLFKLFAGIFSHSVAMVSDAVHSMSDCISTIVVMVAVKLANQKEDKEHPYGHERFECVAAILLSVVLGATGLFIGYVGIGRIMADKNGGTEVPGILALVAAVVSIMVKEVMYWYTRTAAKRINSSALMADAWHHRSDALSSIGSFIGILGARMGFPILDPIACIVICLLILKAAVEIFLDAISKMTDRACDDETAKRIQQVILSQKSVRQIDKLKTRLFGDKIYVDVEIGIDGSVSFMEAHDKAQHVHDAVEAGFPNVKHCMVHVNPVVTEEQASNEE